MVLVLCVLDALASDGEVFRLALDADEAEAFEHGGFAGAATAHERIKDDAVGWSD